MAKNHWHQGLFQKVEITASECVLITTLELKEHFPIKTKWLDKKHILRIAYRGKKKARGMPSLGYDSLLMANEFTTWEEGYHEISLKCEVLTSIT